MYKKILWRVGEYVIYGCGVILICILVISGTFYFETKSYIYASSEEVPEVGAIVIPGAAILRNGTLSPIFIDRVEKAIELYTLKKAPKILVSGDNSTVSYNEVNPVRLYLLKKGVPDQDIFLDHAGFDTYSTMYRARDIFGVSSMIITTQSFHLPRSVYIARKLRIQAYGVDADMGHILFRNYLREIFANEKVVLDLIFNRKPKYLGEQIPIEGDGRNYP